MTVCEPSEYHRDLMRNLISRMKTNDLAATFLAIFGTFIAQISLEISMDIDDPNYYKETYMTFIARSLVTATTIPLLILIIRRNRFQLKYD